MCTRWVYVPGLDAGTGETIQGCVAFSYGGPLKHHLLLTFPLFRLGKQNKQRQQNRANQHRSLQVHWSSPHRYLLDSQLLRGGAPSVQTLCPALDRLDLLNVSCGLFLCGSSNGYVGVACRRPTGASQRCMCPLVLTRVIMQEPVLFGVVLRHWRACTRGHLSPARASARTAAHGAPTLCGGALLQPQGRPSVCGARHDEAPFSELVPEAPGGQLSASHPKVPSKLCRSGMTNLTAPSGRARACMCVCVCVRVCARARACVCVRACV